MVSLPLLPSSHVYNDAYASADGIRDFNYAEGDRIDLTTLDSVNSHADVTVDSDSEEVGCSFEGKVHTLVTAVLLRQRSRPV